MMDSGSSQQAPGKQEAAARLSGCVSDDRIAGGRQGTCQAVRAGGATVALEETRWIVFHVRREADGSQWRVGVK